MKEEVWCVGSSKPSEWIQIRGFLRFLLPSLLFCPIPHRSPCLNHLQIPKFYTNITFIFDIDSSAYEIPPQLHALFLKHQVSFLTLYSGSLSHHPFCPKQPYPFRPSTLNPEGTEKKNLKCSALYLDSKATSAMSCGTICCPLGHGEDGAGHRHGVSQAAQQNHAHLGADTPKHMLHSSQG